jgi:peptide/nickel transport system ATP-binding protein
MTTGVPLLAVEDLSMVFDSAGGYTGRQVVAVDKISFQMESDRAKLLTIVGESGSGKTTLARMLLGLQKPTAGKMRFLGREIGKMDRADLHDYRRQVQPVFQDPYATYNPFYRIDRVMEMLVRKFDLAQTKSNQQALIADALSAVDLRPQDVLGRYPHQLSGGERQRVMLARIYLMKPRLIIADEPISMIDAALRALFLNILLEFRDQYGISCIFITHNLATAYYLGGDIMVMCRGRAIERGDMDRIVKEPSHPYTQLLLDSVPSSDPKQRWTEKRSGQEVEASEFKFSPHACVFVSRCPQLMENCEQQRPDFRQVRDDQEAACFLY